PAELRLHGLGAEIALFHAFHGLGEFGHVVAGRAPTQFAAVLAAAGVDRILLGGGLERGLLRLDRLDQVLGLGLVLDEDVAQLVFLPRALLGLDVVVFLLQVGVGDGMVLQVL